MLFRSYEIVAQMIKGTATLALDTKKHPGALKDEVTSPGGSTIRGVVAQIGRASCRERV